MPSIGFVSYLTGSICFFALAVFLLIRWGNRPGSRQFLLTVVVSCLWAALLAHHAWAGRTGSIGWIIFVEISRALLWILLVWRFLFGGDRTSWPKEIAYWVHGAWISVVLANVVSFGLVMLGHSSVQASSLYIASMFVLAIVGYLLIYQLYRNSSHDRKWEVKFFCLGVGGIFVYDLFVFSLGVLFRGLEGDLWEARGAVNGVLAIVIALSVVRMKVQSTELAVSRKVVFYSTGMLGVGFYLVAISAGGYFIRIIGGNWGTFALIVFFFCALMALLTVIISGQARARLRVFLDKNFFHYRYDYRREWLNLTQSLSAQNSDASLEIRALQAVSQIVKSPGATLWQLVGDRYVVREAWNMSDYAGDEEKQSGPFAAYLQEREWIIDKDEYSIDPKKYGQLMLPDWFAADVKAWLILPLLHDDGLSGFMVLAKSMAMTELTWEDRDLLKSVGRQIAGHLALHRSAQELAETRQFEAYNRLVAFIMHDMKNLIAQQSLVVRNAAKHKGNPEFIDDAIATVDNSVRRMHHLLDQLRRGDQGGHLRLTNLAKLCGHVIEQTQQRQPVPVLQADDSDVRVKVDPERMQMVLGHLVRNAQDASNHDGSVTLFVGREANRAIIEVRDTGSGMSPEFMRERLFVPFDTTKGSKGMGIGVYQARQFVQEVGGELQVSSSLGEGSTFQLSIPCVENSDAVVAGQSRVEE